MGPKEQAVRATLAGRPAAILYEESDLRRKINHCFAGLLNGARQQGRVNATGGLFLGKAECEWDWEHVWPAMKDLGLVDYCITETTHPTGYVSKDFNWSITARGLEVRKDDIEYFCDLLDAMSADRPRDEPKDPPTTVREQHTPCVWPIGACPHPNARACADRAEQLISRSAWE